MPHRIDPFIVLFMRWRIADNAALAAERRLGLAQAKGAVQPAQAFMARQLRAVACHHYGLLLRDVSEARARLPLL
ncbi:MAG: hypothetical protein HY854_12115 [Burkholderiales bacterium]|nr:hypothetical protein [Burkholderiales bacterium]